jgi:hypothetical protein
MARGRCSFRQRDVTAAIKAAAKAALEVGCSIARAEIDPTTGKIVVIMAKKPADDGKEGNEWDDV